MADLKSTHLFEAGGHHEIAYGWHPEYVTVRPGPLVLRSDGISASSSSSTRPTATTTPTPSSRCSRASSRPTSATAFPATDLLYPPYYQDNLKANVSSLVNALFLQENYSPQGLRNLTVNLGARLEFQKLYDFHGKAFLDATNVSPRIGGVYDPFNDGRSKLSFFYGRYYEAIPLNVAARYFGGEGILIRNGIPFAGCANPVPYTWTGAGEASSCGTPAMSTPGQPFPADNATGGQLAAQQRHQLPGADGPRGSVPQRDRRHRRARDHRGSDGPPGLPAPLARQDHRGRHRRPERLHVRARQPGRRPDSRRSTRPTRIASSTRRRRWPR